MARGHSPNVDAFVTILQWLNIPAAAFTIDKDTEACQRPALVAQLAEVLHRRDGLQQREVDHLLWLITTTLRWFDDRQQREGSNRSTTRLRAARKEAEGRRC
jgi:hypothetical protein